jgi:hypothetical protein
LTGLSSASPRGGERRHTARIDQSVSARPRVNIDAAPATPRYRDTDDRDSDTSHESATSPRPTHPVAADDMAMVGAPEDMPLIRAYWWVSIAMLLASVPLMARVYYALFTRLRTLHPIIQASVTLVIPDILLVLNFLPFKAVALYTNAFDPAYCTGSAILTIIGTCTSNAGVLTLAYTTHAVLVRSHQKIDMRAVVALQLAGWSMGISIGQRSALPSSRRESAEAKGEHSMRGTSSHRCTDR